VKKIRRFILSANLFCSNFQKVYMHVKYVGIFFHRLGKADRTLPKTNRKGQIITLNVLIDQLEATIQNWLFMPFFASHKMMSSRFFSETAKVVEIEFLDSEGSGSAKKMFQTRKNFFSSPKQGAISDGAYLEIASHAGFIEIRSRFDR